MRIKKKLACKICSGLNFHPDQVEILLEKAFKCEYCNETFFDKINKDRKYCNECQLLANNKITGRSQCRNKTTSNFIKYNGITFRSSWEALVAQRLHKSLFKYEYEKYKFFLNDKLGHYIPDFYIPEKDVFIEVKSQWLYNSRQKVVEFRKKYPEKKLYVIEPMDEFSMMMMMQYLYGLSHYDFNSIDEKYIEDKIKYTCMLMIDEIIELLRETNYKEHKERKPIDKQHLIEETTDVFIFLMNILHLLKIDPKTFIHTVKQKYTLNRFRILFPKIKFKSISSFATDFHISSLKRQ